MLHPEPNEDPMTEDRLPLAELLAKAGDGDFLRGVAEAVLQLLMEADAEGVIGAGRHERSGERTTYRNGYRDRTLDTRLGSLQLRIPKLRQGSYFPPFLEPRKTSEKALVAVIQEAWVSGVSTRRVDDLVQAMGLAGISKSTVSKLCRDIDERVGAFLDRPLTGDWPYLWLDATYLKQREGGRIVSVAVIIAVAANTEGKREIVGLHIGPSEAETFWAGFLKSLVRRGLRGVKLVISDAHEGLKAAIRRVMSASWQRCRVPSPGFMPGVPAGTDRSLFATDGCATRCPTCQRASRAWWRPPCARPSSNRTAPLPARPCVMLPTNSARNGRSWPPSSMTARLTCWPTWTSRLSTAARSTAQTPWKGSIKRSSAAPTLSASFPAKVLSFA